MCSKMTQYMALDETEITRTINKVKGDDIGVVCGVMARAVAGLPAEKGNSTFSKEEKTGAPLLF